MKHAGNKRCNTSSQTGIFFAHSSSSPSKEGHIFKKTSLDDFFRAAEHFFKKVRKIERKGKKMKKEGKKNKVRNVLKGKDKRKKGNFSYGFSFFEKFPCALHILEWGRFSEREEGGIKTHEEYKSLEVAEITKLFLLKFAWGFHRY